MAFKLIIRHFYYQLLIAVMATSSLYAATWDFTPAVVLSQTYYDNITLSSPSEEKSSEWVSEVRPEFSLTAKGRRLQLSSNYSFAYVNYWGSKFSDRYVNNGSLGADLELIKKHLFINALASVSEQVVDPMRASALGTRAITDNRTETRSVSINPVLRNRFGRYANSLLSYKFSHVSYSSAQIGSFYGTSANYSLSSGTWFNQLTWRGNASIQQGQQNNANNSQVNVRMDYLFVKHWTIFVTAQARKNNYINLGLSGSPYFINGEAGIVWTPSRKLSMEVGGGGVFDASALGNSQLDIEQKTWRAKISLNPTTRTTFEIGREQAFYGRRIYSSFRHYTRKTNWSSTYGETLTTPQQARYARSGFGGATSILNNLSGITELNRLVTNDVILRKRLDVNGKVRRKKVNLNASVFYEKGEYQTSNLTDKRYGGSGGFDIKFSRKLTGSASSSLQRYYFEEQGRANNIYSVNSSLSRRLGKKANASLTYIWQKRSANGVGFTYTTNQLIAKIKITL